MSHRLRLVLIGSILVVIVGLIAGPRLALRRATAERFLARYFAGQVQIKSYGLSLWPVPRATATGVTLRRHGRTDVPPLVTIDRIEIEASVLGLLRSPKHLHQVRLTGLTIRVPPGSSEQEGRADESAGGGQDGHTPLIVDRIVAEAARLEILPDEAGKRPRTFDLRHLDAQTIATDRPLSFRTQLVNPKPRGLIDASGTFGPWNADDAGATPVAGQFTYRDVDLDTIRGIGGHLSAEGAFNGPLRRIAVRGRTHAPDFSVDIARQPIPLDTTFDAHVDGTNGNTYLNRVEARFFNTTLVASGVVVDEPDPASRAVVLDVTIDKGRIEDLMRFALSSAPPLTGDVKLKTQFRLPGSERDVVDKLELNGGFAVERATFASEGVQAKIGEMSARARGKPEDAATSRVATDFGGRFRLANGALALASLDFTVPGAIVKLNGTYGLRSETIDMRGTLHMSAKVSETTSGWKSVLLKLVDPVFAHGKTGSVVPIKLTGTARKPEFGIDAERVVKGK